MATHFANWGKQSDVVEKVRVVRVLACGNDADGENTGS